MAEGLISRGAEGDYHWLTSTEDYSGTLLRICPEIVLNRYVAVTSIDSGIPKLTESHIAAGWTSRQDVAYSPLLQSAEDIPHQVDGLEDAGYDEFYVFDSPPDLGQRTKGNIFTPEGAPAPGRIVEFVSWFAFVLHDQNEHTIVDLFWPQLHRVRPESYVADGRECLTFVSRRLELVDLLHQRLLALHRSAAI